MPGRASMSWYYEGEVIEMEGRTVGQGVAVRGREKCTYSCDILARANFRG